MNKIKVYKNKLRNVKEVYQPLIPQYQALNVEPVEYRSVQVPANTAVAKQQEAASRNRPPAFKEEIPKQQVVLPNIVPQQTWSSLDGGITDDVFDIDTSQQLIDNNNFYTEEAFGYSVEDGSQENSQNLLSIINELDADSYLLLVHGDTICSGPIEEIEDQARALIFGEHDLCAGEPISEDAIVILKRVKIKVGVFLE